MRSWVAWVVSSENALMSKVKPGGVRSTHSRAFCSEGGA